LSDVIYPDSTMGACVEMNTGSAQFGSPTCYAPTAGSVPDTIVMGDIDGKNGVDIVAISAVGVSPIVNGFLNNGGGKGTFGAAAASMFPFGALQDIHLADMNNDGKADLLIFQPANGGLLNVLLSNGDGTFGTPQQYPLQGGYQIAIGDFAGNGLNGVVSYTLIDGAMPTSNLNAIVATCKM
jgi:hypothetical protein